MNQTTDGEPATVRASEILTWPPGGMRDEENSRLTWSVTNVSANAIQNPHVKWAVGARLDPVDIIVPDATTTPTEAFTKISGCAMADMQPGETRVFVATLRVKPQSTSRDGEVTATFGTSTNDMSTATTNVEIASSSEIEISVPETYVVKTEPNRFGLKMNLTNLGSEPERDVEVVFDMPTGLRVARHVGAPGHQRKSAGNAEIVRIPQLEPGASEMVGVEIEVTSLAGDSDIILSNLRVRTKSNGNAKLDPVRIRMPRQIDLSGSKIRVSTDSTSIKAGETVDISLDIRNDGRSDATDVRCEITLPKELTPCPGTLRIDGGPDARRDVRWPTTLARVPGRATVTVALRATLVSPIMNGLDLEIKASIDGNTTIEWNGFASSSASFSPTRNELRAPQPATISPGGEALVTAILHNTGTTEAHATVARLRLDAGHLLTVAHRTDDRATEISYKTIPSPLGTAYSLDLGTVPPSDGMRLDFQIASPESTSEGIPIKVSLDVKHDAEPWLEIGTTTLNFTSAPEFSPQTEVSSRRADELRIGQVRTIIARVGNSGDAPIRRATLDMNMPEAMHIESVQGGALDAKRRVTFDEIAPGSMMQATITIRVTGPLPQIVRLRPKLSAIDMPTKTLSTLRMGFRAESVLTQSTASISTEGDQRVARFDLINTGDADEHGLVVAMRTEAHVIKQSTKLDGIHQSDISDNTPLMNGIPIDTLQTGGHKVLEVVVETPMEESRIDFVVRRPSREDEIFSAIPRRVALQTLKPTDAPALAASDEAEYAVEKTQDGTEHSWDTTSSDTSALDWDTPMPDVIDDIPQNDHDKQIHPTEHGLAAEEQNAPNMPAESTLTEPELEERDLLEARLEDHSSSDIKQEPVPTPPEIDLIPRDNTNQPIDIHGAIAITTMDASRIKRTVATLRTISATEGIGWYRHVVALRLLAPNTIAAAAPVGLQSMYETSYKSLVSQTKMPIIKASMPGFTPSQAWADEFSPPTLLEDTKKMLEMLTHSNSGRADTGPADAIRVIDVGFIAEFESDVPVGGGHLNALLANIMPVDIPGHPEISNALAAYRDLLISEMEPMVYQGEAARHRSLISKPSESELNRAFEQLRNAFEGIS